MKIDMNLSIIKWIIIAGIGILVFGCGPTWHHPAGHDKDKLSADQYECKLQAKKYALDKLSDPNHPRGPRAWKFAYEQNLEVTFNECMVEKGWFLKDEENNDKLSIDREDCKLKAQRYALDKLFELSQPGLSYPWVLVYKQHYLQLFDKCMQEKGNVF